MITNIRNISDFLNTEYLEYSRATVEERAIPSLCDGLKPGARKIFHAANVGTLRDGRTYKLLTLSGDTMNKSQYAHGDTSLNDTIAEKSKNFVNNIPGLEIEGQGGSLRNPDAVGSPRYLYIRKSKYMDMVYRTDYDLLEYMFDEGMELEPKQYLPIIPTVLTSLAMGIANGYSFHTMAYNPMDIVDACMESLKTGEIRTRIRPYLNGIDTSSWRYLDGSWWSYGSWKLNLNRDVLVVTDLPYDVTYEDFEKLLNKYIEKEYIKDYKNMSEDGNVHYEIEFPKGVLSKAVKEDSTTLNLASKFKLFKQIPTDLLWVLDENHKLKYFGNPNELISYFTSWRLGIYTERKRKLVKLLEEKYRNNSDLVKFIELVCANKLILKNRSKTDIKVDMDGYNLPMTLISTPMSKVTIEERNALLKENEEIKKELDYIKSTSEKDMYLDDLAKLKKNIKGDFSTDYPNMKTKSTDIEITGNIKVTKVEKELAKAKKEKEKVKKTKEKEKITKTKERERKAKDKAKKTKEKERKEKDKLKEKKLAIKAKIQKLEEQKVKMKTKFDTAKVKRNRDDMAKYKKGFTDCKTQIDELKNQLKELK